MAGRAFHRAGDGTETDITEGVQAMYDLLLSSMDWGSGFWTYEDALPVAKIGALFGFEQDAEVQRYVAKMQHEHEADAWRREHPGAMPRHPGSWSVLLFNGAMTGLIAPEYPAPHEHVLSSVGKCMWPRCRHQAEQ